MTIKEIKTTFKIFNHDDKYIICPKFEYLGYLTKEKTRWFYNGYPEDEPVQVKSIDDIHIKIAEFLVKCKNDWINPSAFNPMINHAYQAEYALDYVARKFNLKESNKGYSVISSLGAKLFDIRSEMDYDNDTTKIVVTLTNGMFIDSPDFTDYREALNWIKGMFVSFMTTTGLEFMGMIINNNLMNSKMEEVIAKYIDYSDLSVKEFNITDYMINILEKQLEILKNSKKNKNK